MPLSLEEQIARKCIHFTGIMDKVCKMGILYSNVRVDDGDGPYKFPCLKQGGECPFAKFRTDQEVKDEVTEIGESSIKVIAAMISVKDHYSKTKEQTGKVPCQCGGELHYTRANINGHFWVKCNNCGISFNE